MKRKQVRFLKETICKRAKCNKVRRLDTNYASHFLKSSTIFPLLYYAGNIKKKTFQESIHCPKSTCQTGSNHFDF